MDGTYLASRVMTDRNYGQYTCEALGCLAAAEHTGAQVAFECAPGSRFQVCPGPLLAMFDVPYLVTFFISYLLYLLN